jgi:ribokinase
MHQGAAGPGMRPRQGSRRGYGAVVDIAARLTVLGSLNMDISVTVPSLPEPGATVLGAAAVFAPGGKGANQAVAAARLGGAGLSVAMIGCTGDDEFGRTLRGALRAEGVDVSAVRTVAGVPTGIAMITVDRAGENTITVAPGANHEVSAVDLANVTVLAGSVLADPGSPAAPDPAAPDPAITRAASDVLVISAEVPIPVISAALAAAAGRLLRVLNLAPAPPAPPEAAELVAAGPDWLVVNESEAAAVLGRPVAGLTDAAEAAADLVAAGARNAVVTAGAAGAAYCGPGAAAADGHREPAGIRHPAGQGKNVVVTVPGFKIQATDTVGAGDTFIGALAVALAEGVPPVDAVIAATAAGATAATRPGTQSGMPRPADILAVTGHRWPLP